jgi:hypothetical protein
VERGEELAGEEVLRTIFEGLLARRLAGLNGASQGVVCYSNLQSGARARTATLLLRDCTEGGSLSLQGCGSTA